MNNLAHDTKSDDGALRFSRLLVALYKGVVYRERDEAMWRDLGEFSGRAIDHFSPLGLRLIKDDVEGYAYVAYPPDGEDGDTEGAPRLIARRRLSFGVSLMLALLRRKMAEFDTSGEGARLIMSGTEIVEMMRPFQPDSTNEVKLAEKAAADLNKVKELGFVRPLRNGGDRYEVMRILKAYIDAQWLEGFEEKLAAYKDYAKEGSD